MENLANGADFIQKLREKVLKIEIVDLSAFIQPVLPEFEIYEFKK